MSHPTILIADDDSGFLMALQIRLERAGYEVICAHDAYQAVDLARRHRPDLLLIDIRMPAGEGFSVQERIEQTESIAGTPVIYLTGYGSRDVKQKAQALGAFSLLQKPFDAQTLFETIGAALQYAARPEPQKIGTQ